MPHHNFITFIINIIIVAALVASSSSSFATATTFTSATDKQVLLWLKGVLPGPNGSSDCFATWTDSTDMCTWTWVRCDADGRVTYLGMEECDLRCAQLPDDIANLSALTELSFFQNEISGVIPSAWGDRLPLLRAVNLSWNLLGGSLPASWSAMRSLKDFQCYDQGADGEGLSGEIPSAWGYGPIADVLEEFIVADNALSGPLPKSWSRMSKLKTFYAYQNSLSGKLPPEYASMASIDRFSVSTNLIDSTLPPEWANMTTLREIYLYNNAFLHGSLPPEWSRWSRMQSFNIYNANLSGVLPPSYAAWQHVTTIILSSNGPAFSGISGGLPPTWSSFGENLITLDLSKNALQGSVPPSWKNFTSAQIIDLSGNCLDAQTNDDIFNTWLGASSLRFIDVQPTCLRAPPINSSVALAEVWTYRRVNAWSSENEVCFREFEANACDATFRPRPQLIVRPDKRLAFDLFFSCRFSRRFNFISSCISALYVPDILCFVDREASIPCDPALLPEPPTFANTTFLMLYSISGFYTFRGAEDAQYLHGATYRLSIAVGLNLAVPLPGTTQVFYSHSIASAVFTRPPCSVPGSAAIFMSTDCTTCPAFAECRGTTTLRVGPTPAWRLRSNLLPFFECPSSIAPGCFNSARARAFIDSNASLDTLPSIADNTDPAASASDRELVASGAICSPYHQGALCASCLCHNESFCFGNVAGSCVRCPSRAVQLLIFSGSLAGMILLLILFVIATVKPSRKTSTEARVEALLEAEQAKEEAELEKQKLLSDENDSRSDNNNKNNSKQQANSENGFHDNDKDSEDEEDELDIGEIRLEDDDDQDDAQEVEAGGGATAGPRDAETGADESKGDEVVAGGAEVDDFADFDDLADVDLDELNQLLEQASQSKESLFGGARFENARKIMQKVILVVRALSNFLSLSGALAQASATVSLWHGVQSLLSTVDDTNQASFGSIAATASCIFPELSPTSVIFDAAWVIFLSTFVVMALIFIVVFRRRTVVLASVMFLSFFAYVPLCESAARLLALCEDFVFHDAPAYLRFGEKSPRVASFTLLSSDYQQSCEHPTFVAHRIAAAVTIVLCVSLIAIIIALRHRYESVIANGERSVESWQRKEELAAASNIGKEVNIKRHLIWAQIKCENAKTNTREIFSFLQKGYKENIWWYELVNLGRKLLIAMVIGVFGSKPSLQLILYAIVCAILLSCSVGIRPFEVPVANNVDAFCVISAALSAGLVALAAAFPADRGVLIFSAVGVVILQIVPIIFILIFSWRSNEDSDEEAKNEKKSEGDGGDDEEEEMAWQGGANNLASLSRDLLTPRDGCGDGVGDEEMLTCSRLRRRRGSFVAPGGGGAVTDREIELEQRVAELDRQNKALKRQMNVNSQLTLV